VKTLLLDRALWDLCKDSHGNIAVASDPYSVIQDVASAARLFRGELWYDTTKGIPYFQQVLGQQTSLGVVKALLVRAALTVPTVAKAAVFVSSFRNRVLTGQIQSTLSNGSTAVTVVSFPPSQTPITDAYGNVITDNTGVGFT
jgi:hypothetical protein